MHCLLNFCNWYHYDADSNQEMSGQKYACAALNQVKFCGFCIYIRYILTFRCLELCVKKITIILVDCVQTAPEYFAKIKSCEPFL